MKTPLKTIVAFLALAFVSTLPAMADFDRDHDNGFRRPRPPRPPMQRGLCARAEGNYAGWGFGRQVYVHVENSRHGDISLSFNPDGIYASGRCEEDRFGRARLYLQSGRGRVYATLTRENGRIVLEGQVEGVSPGFKVISQ